MPEDCPLLANLSEEEREGVIPKSRGITVDKTIGLDVIISFAALLFTMVIYALTQAEWKGGTENRLKNLEATDIRIQNEQKDQKDEIIHRLDNIDRRFDELIEGNKPRR
jgi:hypothetical protein